MTGLHNEPGCVNVNFERTYADRKWKSGCCAEGLAAERRGQAYGRTRIAPLQSLGSGQGITAPGFVTRVLRIEGDRHGRFGQQSHSGRQRRQRPGNCDSAAAAKRCGLTQALGI